MSRTHVLRSVHAFTVAVALAFLTGCGEGKPGEHKDLDRPKSASEKEEPQAKD